jgi:PAS domain S-box-containing protein
VSIATQILPLVIRAHEEFLQARDLKQILQKVLGDLLQLVDCEAGFIAEMEHAQVMSHSFFLWAIEDKHDDLHVAEKVASLRSSPTPRVIKGCVLLPIFFQGKVTACVGLSPRHSQSPIQLAEDLDPILSMLSVLIRHWKERKTFESAATANINREKALRLALDSVGEGSWDWHTHDKKIFFSEAWLSHLGYQAEELPTIDQFFAIVHPEDIEQLRASFRDHLDGKTLKFEMEHRVQRKNGSYVELLGRAKVIERGEFGLPLRVVGTVVDLTGLRRMQAQLVTAQKNMIESSKFSALGVMAAGIAHEINNPLAIIHAYTEVLENHARLTPEKVEKARKSIQRSVERIAKIVKGLRKVARDGEDDPFESVSVQTLTDEILSFSNERLVNKGVEFKINIEKDAQVWCQPVQISQVLLNLINNSIDAIELQTEKWISLKACRLGTMIVIEFSDSGPGIPGPIQAKIFEPFFTTKQVGKGTGLGLSISRSIIEDHGGKFSLDSSQGHTCFVIEIPSSPAAAIVAAS